MRDLLVPAKADPGLSLREMKEFVQNHFEDFVNRKKSEVALVNFSSDFLDHDEPTGVEVGPEAARNMMEAAYKRWPDLRVKVEDILAEGDKVMVRKAGLRPKPRQGRGSNSICSCCGVLRKRRSSSVGPL